MNVNAQVETIMIPFGFMVPAPLAGLLHPSPVMLHLTALLAVALNIVVDAGAVRFQFPVALVFEVIRASSGTQSQGESPR